MRMCVCVCCCVGARTQGFHDSLLQQGDTCVCVYMFVDPQSFTILLYKVCVYECICICICLSVSVSVSVSVFAHACSFP